MSSLDWKARDLICKDISNNYFVEAGAGSGKTTCLVDRMVSMVEGGIAIDKICAITFTKAAANEFYNRFRKKLAASDTEIAKKALKNIDLCFMGTIDSFCNMIISEHPAKALVPADTEIIQEKDLDKYCSLKLSEIANKKYGQNLYIKYKKVVEQNKSANEAILPVLKFVLSHKNSNLVFEDTNQSLQNRSLDEIFANEKRDLLKFFEWVKNNKSFFKDVGPVRECFKYLDWCIKRLKQPMGSIDDFCYMLSKFNNLTIDKKTNLDDVANDKDGEISKLLNKFFVMKYKKDLDEDGNPKKDCWAVGSLSDNVNSFYRLSFENYNLSLILDFALDAAQIISTDLRHKGMLTFSDYLYYLADMLKKDAKTDGQLIKHINSRHSYFLIDEFQDTDPIQAEIFFYLSAQNLNDDWKKCIPYPGSLFIVGDPKQSIYRFRNADVSSYLNVKKLFLDDSVGQVLELSQNFRSSKPICDWFNDAFEKLLPEIDGLQSKFSQIPTETKTNYDGSFGGVYKHTFSNMRKNADNIDYINVANIVSEIVDNERFTIQDPPDRDGNVKPARKINYEDIMIIVSKKSHLKDYMRALKKNYIPYLIEGNVLFDECPALKAVLALFNWVCEPENKKYEFAAKKIANVDIDVEKIFELQNYFGKLSPCAAFMYLIDELQIITNVGTKNLEYLYYALELLRDKETAGDASDIRDAANFIDELVCENSDHERCLQFVTSTNRVHLANLHKVKGLEAPVVILADPTSKNHNPASRIEFLEDKSNAFIFELNINEFKKLHSKYFAEEKKKENDALDAEKMRLLYVAATRAGCAIVISDIRTDWKKSKNIPDSNPWAPFLRNGLEIKNIEMESDDAGRLKLSNQNWKKSAKNDFFEDAADLYKRAESESALNTSAKEPSYKLVLPSNRNFDDLDEDLEFDDNKEQMFDNQNDNSYIDARLKGTIVHRLMELVCNAKCFDDGKSHFVEQVLNEFDLAGDTYKDCLCKALDEARDLFAELKTADEIYCELPFCYKISKNEICDGVIDLLYKKDGRWFIVDYKTNYDESFLDIKYKDQLDLYVDALKRIEGIDADARILHLAV